LPRGRPFCFGCRCGGAAFVRPFVPGGGVPLKGTDPASRSLDLTAG